MNNVLRITRHEAQSAQVEELKRIFGDDVSITQISVNIESVEQFDALINSDEFSAVEAVLPVNLYRDIFEQSLYVPDSVQLLRAITERKLDPLTQRVEWVFKEYRRMELFQLIETSL